MIISSSQAYRVGYLWQGRDTLPLAIGLPIVAAALLTGGIPTRLRRRLAALVGVLAGLAQFGALFEAMRRYDVGTGGADFSFVLHPSWHGPLPDLFLLIVAAVSLGAAYLGMTRLVAGAPESAGLATPGPTEASS